jgi:hypothetical protein
MSNTVLTILPVPDADIQSKEEELGLLNKSVRNFDKLKVDTIYTTVR